MSEIKTPSFPAAVRRIVFPRSLTGEILLVGRGEFLLCGWNLRRIAFDHSNLLQSWKQHPVNMEHWLKSKLARPVRGFFRNWRQHPAEISTGTFSLQKLWKVTSDLSHQYVHSIFTLLLIQQIFEWNKLLKTASKSRMQFWPRIIHLCPQRVGS